MESQLIYILIVGALALINFVIGHVKKNKERQQRESALLKPAGETFRRPQDMRQPPDDPVKKLMEALGLPPEAAPPPPRVKHPALQSPLDPPRHTRLHEKAKMLQAASPPILPLKPEFIKQSAKQVAYAIPKQNTEKQIDDSSFKKLLRGRDALKKAIVLKEILGSPKGLQPHF